MNGDSTYQANGQKERKGGMPTALPLPLRWMPATCRVIRVFQTAMGTTVMEHGTAGSASSVWVEVSTARTAHYQ